MKTKEPKKVAKVETKKVETKKVEVIEVIETPIIVEAKVETPITPIAPVVEAKVETPVTTEVKKTFIEKILEGLTPKQIQGGRTLYVLEEKGRKVEIVEGGKLFNRGKLFEGWTLRFSSGDKGLVLKADEGKATIKMNSSNLEHSISLHSELEIIDPDFKEAKVEKIKVKTDIVSEAGDLTSERKTVIVSKKGFSFNGQVYASKSFLARDIVAKLALDNPKLDVDKLEKKFPAPFMGKFGLFKEVTEAKKISGTGLPRYFFKPEQLVKVGNKEVAVCNQITTEKINSIIETAKTLGYEITEQN